MFHLLIHLTFPRKKQWQFRHISHTTFFSFWRGKMIWVPPYFVEKQVGFMKDMGLWSLLAQLIVNIWGDDHMAAWPIMMVASHLNVCDHILYEKGSKKIYTFGQLVNISYIKSHTSLSWLLSERFGRYEQYVKTREQRRQRLSKSRGSSGKVVPLTNWTIVFNMPSTRNQSTCALYNYLEPFVGWSCAYGVRCVCEILLKFQ